MLRFIMEGKTRSQETTDGDGCPHFRTNRPVRYTPMFSPAHYFFAGISLDEPVPEAYDIRAWDVNSAPKNGAYGACPCAAR